MKYIIALLSLLILISGCAQNQAPVKTSPLPTTEANSDTPTQTTQPAATQNNLTPAPQNTPMANNPFADKTGTKALTEKNPIAVFETNKGTFKAEIFLDKVPITANNFIKLAKVGFYNNLTFHRIIADFMIQGGDPNGDGTGGPGYEIKDEFHPSLKHSSKGMLSMANAGPNTGGSQFFITLAPTSWLDGKHAIFGKVVEGMDIVDAIGKVKTDSDDRPVSPVVVQKLSIQ